MKRKGPASLRGSLIARKGEASPAGGAANEYQHLRGTLMDVSSGRPPVSVPMPPGVVDGRLGYRAQVGPGGQQPPAQATRSGPAAPLPDEPQGADRRVDTINNNQPAFELSPAFECSDGAGALRPATTPDHQSRPATAAQSRTDLSTPPLPTNGAAAARPSADVGGQSQIAYVADTRRQRSSDGDIGSSATTLRRGVRQGDAVRARPRSTGQRRRRSGTSRGHRTRSRSRGRVGRLAFFATVVLLAVGAGYYGRTGAAQPMVQAVQDTLISVFGSAAPLLAEAVGVSEGALVGEAEDFSSSTAAGVQSEAEPDLAADVPADAADLRVDDVTDAAAIRPGPAAARRGETLSASLSSLSTDGGSALVDDDIAAGVLNVPLTDVKDGVLLNPADADKLPIPLTLASAAAVGTSGTTGPRGDESVSVTTVRLDALASLAVAADVAFPPRAAAVEAPLSNEAALLTPEAADRLGVLSGRVATPISKPLDRARREAGDVSGPVASSADAPYAVQLASYRSSKLAAGAAAKLSEEYLERLGSGAARVVPGPNGLFRVMSVRMERRGDAVSLCDRLKTRGQDCLVVHR